MSLANGLFSAACNIDKPASNLQPAGIVFLGAELSKAILCTALHRATLQCTESWRRWHAM